MSKKKQATQRCSLEGLACQNGEPLFDAAWQAAPDAMVLTAPDGTVIAANLAYFRLYGYAPEDILGKNFSVVFHQDRRAQAQEAYLATFQNPVITPRFETAIVSADGAEHIIEIGYNFLTHNGTRTAMISTIRDITAFKRLEEQRKWAEEQLEERVQQRTRELSLLLAVSQTVASTLEWKPLLSIILEQLKTVVDYDSAILYSTQASQLAILAYQGPQPQSLIQRLARIFEQGPIYRQICQQREPLIIDDLHNYPEFVQAYLQELGGPADAAYDQFRAWMGVPLIVRERVIGMLTLTHHLPDVYTPRHANLAFAMANQVAVALENADLYKQARVLAALQERQHLSRELHSSLSQEMFGISLSAQRAREALAADAYHEALAAIDRVIHYVETGLAVMRALIFELRPDSLRTEGLVAALENLAAVVRTRYQLPIEAFLDKEPGLALESKQVLYRVAQEALQNVVKHSRALAVTLWLTQEDQEVVLEVRDDGRGFDPNHPISGDRGLQTMQEQIASLGGTFTLVSAPGYGTSVIVRLPQHS